MKRTFYLTIVLLFAVLTTASAQVEYSDTIVVNGHVESFDVHDVKALPAGFRLPTDLASSRGFGQTLDELKVRWIDRITNMPEELITFYEKYGEAVNSVLNGTPSWLSDPTLGQYSENNQTYNALLDQRSGALDFTFTPGATKEEIGQAAREAVREAVRPEYTRISVFMNYLALCLSYDYADAFWLNSYFRWGDVWRYRYSWNTDAGTGSITYDHDIFFVLKGSDFDYRRQGFQSADDVMKDAAEFNTLVGNILANCPEGNRYQQVAYFNHWLTTNNCYSSAFGKMDTPPTIIWSPMSALRGSAGVNGPVCEGYARAFKVLCDRKSIPCVLAVGFAKSSVSSKGESHMWNEMQMDDNKWYAVDVTWNDPIVSGKPDSKVSGYENDRWLLLGKYDIVNTNLTFEMSHPLGITWDISSEVTNMWEYTIESLIADYRYDRTAGIEQMAQTPNATGRQQAYTLSGQLLGTYASPQQAQQHAGRQQVLLINGRKVVVK